MEFNKLVFERLNLIFKKYGFNSIEESKNIVRYELRNVRVKLVHNPLENSNTLWIGRKGNAYVEIDNGLMKDVYSSDLTLDHLSPEAFVNNVLSFFLTDGNAILKVNKPEVVRLEQFNRDRSSIYTAHIVEKQNLNAADEAWKDGNYLDVIRYLKKVNQTNLPASIKQRYKIAIKRLKS